MRQLRIGWEEFALAPQVGSRIAFPDVKLDFTNDFDLLRAEVRRAFPSERENFEKLVALVADYEDLESPLAERSARDVLGETLGDPLLIEMLFCPLMYYGSARQNDMDFGQFSIMFRSIFLEGLARPLAGVRLILKTLVRKFKELGGELRLRAGVERLHVEGDRVAGVVLEGGEEIAGRRVLSSAGWLETMRLCQSAQPPDTRAPGELSFIESMSVLDVPPRQLGYDRTILFYNDSEQFHWEKPAELCDVRSGVVCSPNNFAYDEPLEEGLVRITSLANYDRWAALSEDDYRLEKLRWYDRAVASAVRFLPDFRQRVIATDMFTPTTIHRFTGHLNGAVYGAPEKVKDGTTHLKNLFICGTDQGWVGIIGSIVSGISIANRHLLVVE